MYSRIFQSKNCVLHMTNLLVQRGQKPQKRYLSHELSCRNTAVSAYSPVWSPLPAERVSLVLTLTM